MIEIDAASNNGVEEIRDIRDKARYAPTQADYKIYIIDEVHMLSTGAFNALLKTLEEPPQRSSSFSQRRNRIRFQRRLFLGRNGLTLDALRHKKLSTAWRIS